MISGDAVICGDSDVDYNVSHGKVAEYEDDDEDYEEDTEY